MRLAILSALESKPSEYYGPCCCPGPGNIRDFQVTLPAHVIRVKRPEQKSAFISFVRRFYNMTLPEAQKLVNSDGIVFNEWLSTYFLEQLEAQGIEYVHIENPTGKYPLCHCQMKYVCEYEGNFYKVLNARTEQETITLLGPVGGPYIK